MTLLELFGYIASALIAISLMTANIKRLRWINLAGAASFSTYGLLIEAYPVFILNAWITLVDIYFLWRLYTFQDQFDLVEEHSADSPLYSLLLNRYGDDIRQFFPDINFRRLESASLLVIFRNMKPVGLFAYEVKDEGFADIVMDYVIREARDFKTARFLFEHHSRQLRGSGFRYLRAGSNHKSHNQYLLKMGFTASNGQYVLPL
jgi:hypothetical protein